MTTEEISALVRKQAEEARPYNIQRLTWTKTMKEQHEALVDGERRAFIAARLPVLTALVEYGQHKPECESLEEQRTYQVSHARGLDWVTDKPKPCTCGYDQALATIDALMK